MANLRDIIQDKFSQQRRFDNYGEVLVRITAQGFRCHKHTLIEVRSPITAFCGPNGTGKSTLLQLAATAYSSIPGSDVDHFNISDFMIVGTLDPQPFAEDASVEFRYWQRSREPRRTTLSYREGGKQWSGYRRRPQRHVFFTGAGHYLPKIEQRDFVVRYARRLQVLNHVPVASEVLAWTARILGQSYENIRANTVDYLRNSRHRQTEVMSVQRTGIEYSEAHMGYGEGRTIYLVSALERLPERSLILIEEPETSLHPSAQHQLGQYLLDVVNRRNHQIFLSTHSIFLLSALPSASIVYLKRTDSGIEQARDLSPVEVHSLLADGHVKALHILVEDDCARSVLREIIRRGDQDFLRVVDIHIGGDSGVIAQTVRSLKTTGIQIACVRDADKGDSPKENIFKLPGKLAPEREFFESEAVCDHVKSTYHVDWRDFKTTLDGRDHHTWLDRLARRVNQERSGLLEELARVYAYSRSENEIDTLIRLLKEAARA